MATVTWSTQFYHPSFWIPQGTTSRYSLTLTDEGGNPLTLTQITTVSLTIFDLDAVPPVPIAGTWPRDIKNLNGGAVSSAGALTLTLSPTDNAFIDELRSYERRRWHILWTYATGTKTQVMQIDRILANVLETP